MRVSIDGRHFTITPAIRKTIKEGTAKYSKFLRNIVEIHVVLEVEKYRHIAEIVLFAKNVVLKCKKVTNDMYLSVEKALHNMERQLRQHKEKIKAHQAKSAKEIPDEEQEDVLE